MYFLIWDHKNNVLAPSLIQYLDFGILNLREFGSKKKTEQQGKQVL